jgi:hypothetical protein
MWFQKLTAYLKECGFNNYDLAECVFIRKTTTGFAIIEIYVDDLNILGTKEDVQQVKDMMTKKFEMKELGPTSHGIGLQIHQTDKGILVHQSTTTTRVLEKYGMDKVNPRSTPMEVNGEKELYGPANEGESVNELTIPYRSAIGALSWLATRTRPDIAYAVNVLQRSNQAYTRRHWEGVKRIMSYLNGTRDLGLWYTRNCQEPIEGYADAGYKSDYVSGKSQGGFVFKMSGAAISWKSKKQTLVATSTAHAELLA